MCAFSEKLLSKEFHCWTVFKYVGIQLFIYSVNFAENEIILKLVLTEN